MHQLIEQIKPKLTTLNTVFLTNYPTSLTNLTQISPHNPTTNTRFKTYINKIKLTNGFNKLINPTKQHTQLKKNNTIQHNTNMKTYTINKSFLNTLKTNLPPYSNITLKINHLIILATKTNSIDNIIMFPPKNT